MPGQAELSNTIYEYRESPVAIPIRLSTGLRTH